VGLIAGIIGSNPGKADELIGKMFPLPPEDDWVIIRGIAYWGRRDGRTCSAGFRRTSAGAPPDDREVPQRKLPTLDDLSFAGGPTTMDKFRNFFSKPPKC